MLLGVVAFARELARWMPRRAAAAAGLALLVAGLEAAGVLLLARLLALVDEGRDAGAAGVLGRAVDAAFRAAGAEATVGSVLALFAGVAVAVAAAQRAATLLANRVEQETALRARTRLYGTIAEARWPALARARGADLLAALTGEAARAGAAASLLLSLVVHSVLVLVYLGFAVAVSPTLAPLALLAGAALLWVLGSQRRAARRAGEEGTRADEGLVASASEHLGALRVVKSYGAEARNARIFAAAAERAAGARLRAWRAYADARAAFSAGAVLLLAATAWLALELLRVPAATVFLLLLLFYRLVPRLAQLQTIHQMLLHDLPAWEGIASTAAALEAEREALAPASAAAGLRDGIQLEGVSFAYRPGSADAVHRLDLEIPARRTTAVVGPSGAGKSTVADLVTGLVPPREGRIRVDGRELDEGWLRAWRAGIGYVAQDTLLFDDTVLANLRWAHPDATEDDAWEALRLAAADEVVRALPQGMATPLGERGARLSGGERQRLALARALLRRPSLLILDEATSALDAENERRVLDALRGLQGSVAILLITHRLASVRGADLVHVLDGGRLAESGTPAELLARPGGRFRRLWDAQGD